MSRCVKNSSELKLSPAYMVEYEEYIDDCHSAGIVLRHKKSGARVCVLSNEDDNKCFAIGFRTTPTDGTGVPHIIEHSVLCGSDKFPVKDPFVELMKGSLNTFLNAMTYPDKTVYPVASCNDTDFANLMDVYMDAVLHPNIYHHEEIFKQEGWHYELNSVEEPVTINGIVYSEMKGAFASPDSLLGRGAMNALFPDTTYGVESGGDPKEIPTLTYQQFLDFHSRYYHPTNSYILLYGNMDVEERLDWMDREYLSKYDVQPVDSEVGYQKPIGTKEVNEFYPIGADDPTENVSYIAWNFMLTDRSNKLKNVGMNILMDVLINSTGAPLKEALVKAGIGQDVSSYIVDDILQPYASITVQNTEASKMPEFKRVIRETLESLVQNGLNRNSLLAAVNHADFSYSEADFGRAPKGLIYGLNAVTSWLYDDTAAFADLHMKEIFGVLRDNIDTDFYTDLIREFMLNNKSEVYYTLSPDKEMAVKEDAALKKQMEAYKASLSDTEIKALVDATAALKAYQAEPSTDEQLRTIPLLKREEIDRDMKPIIVEDTQICGIPAYYHDIETNGIVYLRLLFDMDRVPKELIPYVGLVNKLLGSMDTKQHTYLEFDNEVNIHTGGISNETSIISMPGRNDDYRPMYFVTGRALESEFGKLLELIGEKLLDTDMSSLTRVRELIAEKKAQMQSFFNNVGVNVAIRGSKTAFSSAGVYDEMLGGVEFYDFICKLCDASDDELRAAVDKCRQACSIIFGKDNLLLDVTCNRELFDRVSNSIGSLTGKFGMVRGGNVAGDRLGMKLADDHADIAYKVPGEVNYVAFAGRYEADNWADEGVLGLLGQIGSTAYIWTNIRVLGGAYGGGFSANPMGGVGLFYSYRDPKLTESLDVYRKFADYVREFNADEREMTKYVIGTIGDLDTPFTPFMKGNQGLNFRLTKRTYEDIQTYRHAILDASLDDIHRCAKYIDQIVNDPHVCVVGNERKINENSKLFGEIRNLI